MTDFDLQAISIALEEERRIHERLRRVVALLSIPALTFLLASPLLRLMNYDTTIISVAHMGIAFFCLATYLISCCDWANFSFSAYLRDRKRIPTSSIDPSRHKFWKELRRSLFIQITCLLVNGAALLVS